MPRRGEKKARVVVGDVSDPFGMPALLAGFLEWSRVHNYSPATVHNREMYLLLFMAWCEERGVTRPVDVTRPVLERYQRALFHLRREKDGRPLSFRGQHARLVPLRSFFRWLSKQNLLLSNPAADLELPKLEKRLPKYVLTSSEAEAVLGQADVESPLGVRDRAILETLYSTGMRRMELVQLSIYDMDADRGTVMIRQGKGKKDRMVPIGERALSWVTKYQEEVRPSLVVEPDPRSLYLTHEGEAFTPNRLTQMVRLYVNGADVAKKGSCHLFRHTMATLMLENGADIRFIQAMLGHAQLSTTEIYTQVSIKKLKEIHTASHPAAKLSRTSTAASALAADDDGEPPATQEALLAALNAEGDDEGAEE
jgi:integrase/recombinase XerD